MEEFEIADVLKLRCFFCKPEPKDKYFVVVSVEPEPILLFINSELNPFVARNPNLTPCHIEINGDAHEFLTHDSWINCCEPCIEFTTEEIETDLKYGGENCGKITKDTVKNIVAGIERSKTIKRKTKALILSSL